MLAMEETAIGAAGTGCGCEVDTGCCGGPSDSCLAVVSSATQHTFRSPGLSGVGALRNCYADFASAGWHRTIVISRCCGNIAR